MKMAIRERNRTSNWGLGIPLYPFNYGTAGAEYSGFLLYFQNQQKGRLIWAAFYFNYDGRCVMPSSLNGLHHIMA